MHIVWIKDGRKGHEKQVEALLDALGEFTNFKLTTLQSRTSTWQGYFYYYICRVLGVFWIKYIRKNTLVLEPGVHIDWVIGAGQASYPWMLILKQLCIKHHKTGPKLLGVLSPQYGKKHFDILCLPEHTKKSMQHWQSKLAATRFWYFIGALAKTSQNKVEPDIAMFTIGGVSKRYSIQASRILKLLTKVLEKFPEKKWYVFTSKRTPTSIEEGLKDLRKTYANVVCDNSVYDEIIQKAGTKMVTADSVSMIYECLSTRGKTYFVDLPIKREDAIVKASQRLISEKSIGQVQYDERTNNLILTDQDQDAQPLQEAERMARLLFAYMEVKPRKK